MPQMLAALEEKENIREHVVLRYCAPAHRDRDESN
jgi:hypothetical protein